MRDGAWTLHVGSGPTRAAFVVQDVASVQKVLGMFTETGESV